MTKFSLFAAPLFFSFLLLSCNDSDKPKLATEKEVKPIFDLSVAQKEIEAANRNFMDIMSKNDSVGVANCYTADAKFMAPNGPALVGRKSIQTGFSGLINAGISQIVLTTTNVWGDETVLAEEGAFTLGTKGGKQVDKGKYIVVWKKEDGKWKLFRDCFNSDLPIMAAK